MILEIRSYTQRNSELAAAHHFLFDLRLGSCDERGEFLVVGINPGEIQSNWEICNFPTEETSEFCFHDEYGNGRKNSRWVRDCYFYCGTKNVVLSEFFFWSSRNLVQFKERFGELRGNKHLGFCFEQNKKLISFHKPKAILSPGINNGSLFQSIYSFSEPIEEIRDSKGHRIMEVRKDDQDNIWIFTKHWTGARHYRKVDKKKVRDGILKTILKSP